MEDVAAAEGPFQEAAVMGPHDDEIDVESVDRVLHVVRHMQMAVQQGLHVVVAGIPDGIGVVFQAVFHALVVCPVRIGLGRILHDMEEPHFGRRVGTDAVQCVQHAVRLVRQAHDQQHFVKHTRLLCRLLSRS